MYCKYTGGLVYSGVGENPRDGAREVPPPDPSSMGRSLCRALSGACFDCVRFIFGPVEVGGHVFASRVNPFQAVGDGIKGPGFRI